MIQPQQYTLDTIEHIDSLRLLHSFTNGDTIVETQGFAYRCNSGVVTFYRLLVQFNDGRIIEHWFDQATWSGRMFNTLSEYAYTSAHAMASPPVFLQQEALPQIDIAGLSDGLKQQQTSAYWIQKAHQDVLRGLASRPSPAEQEVLRHCSSVLLLLARCQLPDAPASTVQGTGQVDPTHSLFTIKFADVDNDNQETNGFPIHRIGPDPTQKSSS